MFTLRGDPDRWTINNRRKISVAGRNWSDSIRNDLNRIVQNFERNILFDMGNIEFISMFEWVAILATIDKILSSPFTKSFDINFLPTVPNYVPKPYEYIGILKKEEKYNKLNISKPEFEEINKLYRLTGFLESLGTLQVLNRPKNNAQAHYQWLSESDSKTRAFYSSRGDKKKPTTVLGLTLIESKEHCKWFLDDQQIHSWREAMESRFRNSPLFRSDEIWRVIFHELAVNIWEHSGTSGFISSRIVLPYNYHKLNYIWQHIFPDIKDNIWPIFKKGLLEICVSDAGEGIVNTLKQAYIEICGKEKTDTINDEDILSFAFDELGTCKSKETSWVTERHALARTLSIVSKYGGALTIRSGMAEIIYVTKGGLFERLSYHHGYKPTFVRNLPSKVQGTQIQLLLPLFPKINIDKNIFQKSVLECCLPSAFTTESSHPHGHLVPLREALAKSGTSIGAEEALLFKKACEELSQKLVESRPASEPIVFDFSGLNWTAAQFETFLYYLQNIIQNRPTLIVELSCQLVSEIKELEHNNAKTGLNSTLLKQAPCCLTGTFFNELSEKKYLETYKSVYAILLCLDEKGSKHIFALPSLAYEEPLVSLIENPNSIEGLCKDERWKNKINQIELELILHNINPLFQLDGKNIWRCVWDNKKLYVEMNRVMSRHFDQIAKRSEAWRGAYLRTKLESNEKDKKELSNLPIRFNLSWQKEWRKDFLESSQILSRERYVDEAAQRLIFRLQNGLNYINKSLKNIRVLACPTGPAMLLATALHRWWPEINKPIVADMSYYTLLSSSEQLPRILLEGDVVIVQDILDKGTISGKLIRSFQNRKINVVCVIGLIRLTNNDDGKMQGTRVTQLFEGWKLSEEEKEKKQIPIHAMIEVKGPEKCAPLAKHEGDSNSFWIEPRALYPIKYSSLRREFAPGHDSDLDRRNKYLPIFDSPSTGCLFASGHYVYGQRHYAVAVNVRETLNGQLGNEIANWLANICLGNAKREDVSWERQESKDFVGSVTAVLMPLHSQIHYLWPKVANILAQCGRRQPVWLIDATLFTGSGAAYRLPAQLINQIESAVESSLVARLTGDKNKNRPLRLLILDDAITTARTAETILGAITRKFNETFEQCSKRYPGVSSKEECTRPIEWIRYFAVFSQLGYARHLLWKNIKHLDGIPFTLEECAPFMGVPVYDEKNCPICRDRRRLERLILKCEQLGAIHTSNWANDYLETTSPIAIDSPWEKGNKPEHVESGIDILGVGLNQDDSRTNNTPKHADTAIWLFYEYMYLSYPIGDFLFQIEKSWPQKSTQSEISSSFPQPYRWAVLEWCLRNWARVEAATAKGAFLACALKELENNTDLLERILEASTQHYSDPIIKNFIKKCITHFADAEKKYQNKNTSDTAILYLKRLEIGLTAFFLNIPKRALDDTFSPKDDTELVDVIQNESSLIDKEGPSFIKNLYARLKRPRRIARPDWALNVIAEALLRGRNPDNERGGHDLLPGLIGKVLSSCRYGDWFLLQGSVSLFLAALDDLSPYTILDPSFDEEEGVSSETVKQQCVDILKWYRDYTTYEKAQYNPPRALSKLDDLLTFNGSFIQRFHKIFHAEVSIYKKLMEERENEIDKNKLLTFNFVLEQDEDVHSRCLAPVQRLSICLANLAIDHIAKCEKPHQSRIICYRKMNNNEPEKIIFRILTNFADPVETTDKLNSSVHSSGERKILSSFGVVFDQEWSAPNQEESQEGFSASLEITIPSGYLPRS